VGRLPDGPEDDAEAPRLASSAHVDVVPKAAGGVAGDPRDHGERPSPDEGGIASGKIGRSPGTAVAGVIMLEAR
jgi:hypothetical protein